MASIRIADLNDVEFLDEMLIEAAFWNPATVRPPRTGNSCKHLDGWGRTGDYAVIAEADDQRVGAAWHRLWTPENHSWGFVDSATPELGIAVVASHRGQGIGRAMLEALIEAARENGYSALSLSVSPENSARLLYGLLGFRKVGESGTSWTFRLALT